MNDFAIEVSGLKKFYRNQRALNHLDLRVPAGSIFGFLGRNGAGKTTTIKILMGMLRADGGTARIFGMDIGDPRLCMEARSRIGFVTEDKDLFPYMTVEQMIRFTRPFFPRWRDDLESRYLKIFDLPPKRKISDLSKGMRSKLMLLPRRGTSHPGRANGRSRPCRHRRSIARTGRHRRVAANYHLLFLAPVDRSRADRRQHLHCR